MCVYFILNLCLLISVAVQESSGEGSDGSEFAPSNIEELLKGMSVCQNIGNVKGNCCDVIIGTVSICISLSLSLSLPLSLSA